MVLSLCMGLHREKDMVEYISHTVCLTLVVMTDVLLRAVPNCIPLGPSTLHDGLAAPAIATPLTIKIDIIMLTFNI